MKTEFISLASHQLRTPLSAMKWFLEMLLHGDAGKLNDEQTEFVNNIDQSNNRMIELVNSLLNVSRIESGRIIIEPKPTNLKDLVEEVLTEVKTQYKAKKQTVIFNIHNALPLIPLDQKLIRQVYLNLLTNAMKYSPPESEIIIFISKENDKIVSQITDSGYGIPKNEQSHIFTKFYRATNAIKKETEGNGLGLYLVQSIIESSGGKIWFTSDENQKGTSFYFTIPLTGMKEKAGEVHLS
jgi:signal transduction histidine kinase